MHTPSHAHTIPIPCTALTMMPIPAPAPPQVKPEAQSYYELGAATLKFNFPDPPPLDGVTSRQKAILSMKKVCLGGLAWRGG